MKKYGVVSALLRLPDGRDLHFLSYGKQESRHAPHVILYHHGWPSYALEPSAAGLPLISALNQARCRLIAVNRPGVDQSSPCKGLSFASVVQDCVHLLDHLKVDRAYVMGTSGGGPYALACVALAPDRFAAVALVAGMTHATGPDASRLTQGMDPGNALGYRALDALPRSLLAAGLLLARPCMLAAGPLTRLAARLLPRLPSPLRRTLLAAATAGLAPADAAVLAAHPELVTELGPAMLAGSVRGGVGGLLDDMLLTSRPWAFRLEGVRCRVHMWQGLDDVNVPPAMGWHLKASLPNCVAHFVPGEGHLSLAASRMAEVVAMLAAERGA